MNICRPQLPKPHVPDSENTPYTLYTIAIISDRCLLRLLVLEVCARACPGLSYLLYPMYWGSCKIQYVGFGSKSFRLMTVKSKAQ